MCKALNLAKLDMIEYGLTTIRLIRSCLVSAVLSSFWSLFRFLQSFGRSLSAHLSSLYWLISRLISWLTLWLTSWLTSWLALWLISRVISRLISWLLSLLLVCLLPWSLSLRVDVVQQRCLNGYQVLRCCCRRFVRSCAFWFFVLRVLCALVIWYRRYGRGLSVGGRYSRQ